MKLAVALVGVGNIARSMHIPCLKSQGANVIHAVDPSLDSLYSARLQFHKISVSNDISGVPKEANCVVIASPTAFHFEQTKTMLERGIHVLCEKPLAATKEQANQLAELARKEGLVLQVGYYRRYHPSAKVTRSLIGGEGNGKIQTCEMYGGGPIRTADVPSSFFDPGISCGGVLMDLGTHLIDRLLSWFDEITLVSYHDDFRGGAEANAIVEMLGGLRNNGTARETHIPIRVQLSRTNEVGNYSYLRFDEFDLRVEHNRGHSVQLRDPRKKLIAGREVEWHHNMQVAEDVATLVYFEDQWKEFVERISGNPERTCNLEDAVRTSALVEECYHRRKGLEAAWERQIWGEYA